MPHTRAAEAVGLAEIITPHVGVGMSDTLGSVRTLTMSAFWAKGETVEWMTACGAGSPLDATGANS
jgi:hypothetical protein